VGCDNEVEVSATTADLMNVDGKPLVPRGTDYPGAYHREHPLIPFPNGAVKTRFDQKNELKQENLSHLDNLRDSEMPGDLEHLLDSEDPSDWDDLLDSEMLDLCLEEHP
jgi:hypothetical protein